MGKTDPDASKGSRKRQLNVIYFVDSARTRSFTIPLGRLNVLLFAGLSVAMWSVASLFLIVWLVKGREDLASRLRNSLATVFEYETRDDNVFDIAYPPGKATTTNATVATNNHKPAAKTPTPAAKPAVPPNHHDAPPAGMALSAAANPAAAKPVTVANADDIGDEPDQSAEQEAGDEGDKPASAAASAKAPTAAAPAAEHAEPAVAVGNPVLEAGEKSLELRFDLTNKASSHPAEGYIYAVAEFKTDQGEHLFIGAPSEIKVQADGEPTFPLKSAVFAIRRFKQKSFRFPFVKNKNGVFTGVKISVMDRSGANRTTYSVPVQIRVGKGSKGGKDESGDAAGGAPKSG